MKRFNRVSLLSFCILTIIFGSVGLADAQRRNDREVRDILRSMNTKLDDFEYNIGYQLRSNSTNRGDTSAISVNLRNLKRNISEFQNNFESKRETKNDVTRIIDSAREMDKFIKMNSQIRQVERDWAGVRQQIERLSASYGVTADWTSDEEPRWVNDDQGRLPAAKLITLNAGLTGTYQIDAAGSETVDEILRDTKVSSEQREDLREKIEAPEQIAIDVRGNLVTFATSKSSPVTFTADGRDKVEKSGSGKTIRLRATLSGQVLTVSNLGGDTDYTIIFTSEDNGKTLKVSRRITTDYLDQTVFAESMYNKSDSVAGLGIDRGGNPNNTNGGYSDNDQNTSPANGNGQSNGGYPSNGRGRSNGSNPTYGRTPSASPARTGDFIVPSGTIIGGTLDNEINTKISQNNDRFRLNVQSPREYRGAVIEGYISNVERSGKVTGDANVTLNFERITLSDGKTYDFVGYLQSVTDLNGKNVKVDAEGTVRGDNQTKQTAKRGGVGAGLGALIGAIAGGGRGAAIGAVIGGGAGAGSVAIQGSGDVVLQQGSTMVVQSSSPAHQNDPTDK